MSKVLMVDPPSGWRYGFPDFAKDDYKQQLRDHGYPEKDIEFALKHSRYWETDILFTPEHKRQGYYH